MANTIKHKRGSGSNPGASDLAVGELAIRTDTGVVFTKKDDGTVAEIAGGGASALNDLSDAVTNSSGVTIGLGTNALANDDGTTNDNTALGYNALNATTSGSDNVAVGHDSLMTNTTGERNTGVGWQSLEKCTEGQRNTCIGASASNNLTTGSNNTSLGFNAGNITTGSNNLSLGNSASPSSQTVSNQITLGNSSITSFRIPGLQSSASNGQVLTYNSTDGDIELADVSATVASGAIYENSQSITASYTITTNKNAMSAGPIDIASGATVTVPSGSVWSIV